MAVDAMGGSRLKVTDLNPHISCILCGGYFIDATTITQCLHSFCRACIVRYLETSNYCPVCEVQVHKSKPLRCIRSDRILQDIVYKLVPGLFQNEMCRRRELYASQPPEAVEHSRDEEDRGEGMEKRFIYTADEIFELILRYKQHLKKEQNGELPFYCSWMCRFLRCPAAIRMSHLKKFIRYKFNIPNHLAIEIEYEEGLMNDDYSLIDVAYIYSWKRTGPLQFNFSIVERPKIPPKTFVVPPPRFSPSGKKLETEPMQQTNTRLFSLSNDKSTEFSHRKRDADSTSFRTKRMKSNARHEKELMRRAKLDKRERRTVSKEKAQMDTNKNFDHRLLNNSPRKKGRPPKNLHKKHQNAAIDNFLFEERLVIAESPKVDREESFVDHAKDVKKSYDDYEVDSGRGSDTSSIRSPLGADDDFKYKSLAKGSSKAEPLTADSKQSHLDILDLSVCYQKNSCEITMPRSENVSSGNKHRHLTPNSSPNLGARVHPSLKPLPAVLPHVSVHKKHDYSMGNFRCHRGSTLTVINPDPSSSQTKIVIKNLNPRPKYYPICQKT